MEDISIKNIEEWENLMSFKGFEELPVWQKARDLAITVSCSDYGT